MIKKVYYINSNSLIPYENQGLEEYLFRQVNADELILYLWQNKRTVVIGRNQNCWRECRVEELLADGGYPARRLSGGGAVFHDLGNLNFTFCVREADYDVARQLSVIVAALQKTGIPAEKSGRNDILAGGRKFSGNAFYHSGSQRYHHGTIMVDVDMSQLGRYLNPSPAKLAAKGVTSVRSRVINLRELSPELTVDQLRILLIDALGEVYGIKPQELVMDADDRKKVDNYTQDYRDWDWIYGTQGSGDVTLEHRFDWGELILELTLNNGYVEDAVAYSDAMDGDFVLAVGPALNGSRYEQKELISRICAVATSQPQAEAMLLDIGKWLRQAI